MTNDEPPSAAGNRGTRITVALVSCAILLVAAATIYFTELQVTAFQRQHEEILASEVNEAANAIEQFITDRQRLVEAFAYDHQALLTIYADNVENERLRARIDDSLRRWFPSYFTFTLADQQGTDLVDDLEGFVGEACQINIRDFVADLKAADGVHAAYEAVIHPQANNYHFDIMSPWRSRNELNGVFFVSFYPETLQTLLRSYQSPGHYLALVHRDRDYLIEISPEGARDKIASHRDISLTAEEIDEIRESRAIPGSLWTLVGYTQPGLIARAKQDYWLSAIFIVSFILLAGGLSLWRILKLDKEQQKVLAQLQTSNSDLADLAAEQTALRTAAEAGEKTKAQFLAAMSHEIRTPLNAVIGLTNLVLDTKLDDHQKDHLTRVSRAGQSLLALINDILDFSKIEAGGMQIETVDFDLDEVLENLATIVSAKAEENGNELIIMVDREIPPLLRGDPLRLGQILINLAGNAAKFTARGEIVVNVSQRVEAGDRFLVFSVRDSGIGMTEEQVSRLFKPFTQADQSITRTHGGTGLGLSISHELVGAMGGTLEVESEPGKGSRFFFEIPMIVSKNARPRKAFEGIDPRATYILVVDDNDVVRETLLNALGRLHFNVDVAASGPEALRLYENAKSANPYDIVLMDLKMPDMDGIETTEHLKAKIDAARMPVIIMISAGDKQSFRTDLERLGIEHWVQKPINTSFLIDTMMAFTKAAPGRRSVRARSESESPSALRKDIRLLLAEDNELNQMVANGVLSKAGFTLDMVSNGQQAIDILSEKGEAHYALVLMDLEMPELDGLTATRKIREELGFTDIPVIAMTAHAMEEERERCHDAGMNDHVSKPIDARDLIVKVNKWARSSVSAGETGSGTTAGSRGERA